METNIYIDAGHGGYDNGATYNGRREKEDNLKLALAVGESLRSKGIETNFTREKDVYQSPSEKAQIANQDEADLFISFHRSSSPSPNTATGVEAYVYETGGVTERLANNINSNLEKIGFDNLGVHVNKNLTILKKTNMPAVLLDIGYVNTDADNKKFDDNFDEIVNAITNAIVETLNQGNNTNNNTDTPMQNGNMNGRPIGTPMQNGNMNGRPTGMPMQNGNMNGRSTGTPMQNGGMNGRSTETPMQNGGMNGRSTGTPMQNGNMAGTPTGPQSEVIDGVVKTVEYAIQAGLFKTQENALTLIDDLQSNGIDAQLEPMGGYWAVIIGNYKTIEEAEKMEEKIQNLGYETIVIER